MMHFTILDVGHGFCAYLIADNGNSMVFDCGHKTEPEEVRPSDILRNKEGQCSIEALIITNYDEDHISDLPNIQEAVKAKNLVRNTTITASQLRALKKKSGPISPAMKTLLDTMDEYDSPVFTLDFPNNVRYKTFHNSYGTEFNDTNNISLVTFLSLDDKTFLIPGDMEKPGWEGLLIKPDFKEMLRDVNVFIASHHGRENGYCPDVFDYCSPEVIIFSDGPKVYATQEMVNTYKKNNHALGISFNGEKRYVLTTRKDGSMTYRDGVWQPFSPLGKEYT